MECNEIDLERLRKAVNDIINHLVEDLGMKAVQIEDREDFYWTYSAPEAYDSTRKPLEPEVGRLSDDLGSTHLIQRGANGDVSFNLVHVAPLLKYIGEKVKR
jgi:hypothetical protein